MNPQNAPEHPILSISSSKSSKFVTYAQYKPADINEQRSILVYSNNKYQVLIGGMQVYFKDCYLSIFLLFCFCTNNCHRSDFLRFLRFYIICAISHPIFAYFTFFVLLICLNFFMDYHVKFGACSSKNE